jgi:hypothetical protein
MDKTVFVKFMVEEIVNWSNQNSGFLTLSIFFSTILLGWLSGIFKALRRKPKFQLSLNEGPTFLCTFPTGRKINGNEAHRTVITLYLTVKNVGSAPSTLSKVIVGYRNHLPEYAFRRFWLNQVPSLRDFGHTVGKNLRVYPFLIQASFLKIHVADAYLREGQETKGIAYFEQEESWGGALPRKRNNTVNVKVKIFDVYGKSHSKRFNIPIVSLEHARLFNPEFGNFLENLRNTDREKWNMEYGTI